MNQRMIKHMAVVFSDVFHASNFDTQASVRAVVAELAKTDVADVLPSLDDLANVIIKTTNTRPSKRALDFVVAHVAPLIGAQRAHIAELEQQLHCWKYPGHHQVPNENGTTHQACNGCDERVDTDPGHTYLDCSIVWRRRMTVLETECDSLKAKLACANQCGVC